VILLAGAKRELARQACRELLREQIDPRRSWNQTRARLASPRSCRSRLESAVISGSGSRNGSRQWPPRWACVHSSLLSYLANTIRIAGA
jgi:hypothetical protein